MPRWWPIDWRKRRLLAATLTWFAAVSVAAPALCDERIALPGGAVLTEVDFERHVTSLFGRSGCNAAACHGAFQGKGGFRLSLFGQSPDLDYESVLGTPGASRVDLQSPEESLLLLKPSGRVPHRGGVRFSEDSWEDQVLRQWIATGARRSPGSGTVAALTVDPVEIPPLSIGQTASIRVFAQFADGQREDVTAFAEFRIRDETVAKAGSAGAITALSPGDTSVIVSYRGAFLGTPILVPYVADPQREEPQAIGHWIDEEIYPRLSHLRLAVSPPATDAEFLRRATLDVTGTVPTPDEVRSFMADADSHKRSKQIDRLLRDPRRATLWAAKMCDITACNIDTLGPPEALRPKRAKMWHDWFARRFAANLGYDQMVQGVLCATSRHERPLDAWIDDEIALERMAEANFDTTYHQRPGLDLYWRRVGPQGPLPVEDLAELTATAFLGLRLHCARCHQHPYDRWTQHDFAGFANIFARVQFGSSTELRVAVNERLDARRTARREGRQLPEMPRIQEVFLSPNPRPLVDSQTSTPAPPKAPAGPLLSNEHDPREELFQWMTRPDNPYFAASFVNRVWAKYFGAGLVEPVDDFSAANPATHPRLLRRLADEFSRSGYDIRELERQILSSAAYQRSVRPAGNNAADLHNFSHAAVRPLLAEVLLDSINQALEASDDYGPDVPRGSQAIELAPNRFTTPAVNELFRILGRGDRKSFCECDRASGPSLRRTLFLLSDSNVVNKLRGGRLARLVAEQNSNGEIIDELYLATVSRLPDDDEREFGLQHVATNDDRTVGLADIAWALINSREFTTNH
ncbi:MAG: DUF1549 and DUF1553 domain-containing protein [Planctomycetales bacterium]